jgi:hypothetical protein
MAQALAGVKKARFTAPIVPIAPVTSCTCGYLAQRWRGRSDVVLMLLQEAAFLAHRRRLAKIWLRGATKFSAVSYAQG